MIDFSGWPPADLEEFIRTNGRYIDGQNDCGCDTCREVANSELSAAQKVRLAKEALLARRVLGEA